MPSDHNAMVYSQNIRGTYSIIISLFIFFMFLFVLFKGGDVYILSNEVMSSND